MGKTRDLFKKIRDTKETFHEKMGSIKDRNGMDRTEAEDIKKRWQEYWSGLPFPTSLVHTISVLYCAYLSMKCSLGIAIFLEEISSLSHYVFFFYFFTLIAEEGFFISPCYSLELCIQILMSFLFSFAFCFRDRGKREF